MSNTIIPGHAGDLRVFSENERRERAAAEISKAFTPKSASKGHSKALADLDALGKEWLQMKTERDAAIALLRELFEAGAIHCHCPLSGSGDPACRGFRAQTLIGLDVAVAK